METIEVKAGKMKMVGTTVTADTRKGMLRMFTSPEDQLLHLTWTSRERGGITEDDYTIFPGEAEVKYVEQAKNNAKNNRVYLLKFKEGSGRHFFWMQNPSADKDEEVVQKINSRLMGTTSDLASSGMGGIDQQQLLQRLTQMTQSAAAAVAGAGASDTSTAPDLSVPANTSQQLSNSGASEAARVGMGTGGGGGLSQASLQQILANLGGGARAGGNMQAMANEQAKQREGPSLSDVLDGKDTQEALSHLDDLQLDLLEQLPVRDRSVDGLNAVLRSPQLAQAVAQLDQVLQSGQGRELLLSFGLQPAQGFDMYGPPAVKNLLDQIQKKHDDEKT